MKIYHLKNCDTCRKAIKAIEAAGHSPQLIDVRADGIARHDLETAMSALGHGLLLNTRSTTWRGLDAAEKEGVENQKAVELIMAHPTLLKRPLIMDGDKITVGWKADAKGVWV